MNARTPVEIVMDTWQAERGHWAEERERMRKTIKFLRTQNARLKRTIRKLRARNDG